MIRVTLFPAFLFAVSMALGQINPLGQQEFDLSKEYSFDDSLTIGSPYDAPLFDEPKGILDNNPFTSAHGEAPILMPNHAYMPILHPAMEGLGMPVKHPDPDVRYSLRITPPITPDARDRNP